ncbi:hypothetical protein, partial [Pseudomonas aeruginosa]|uniref:hypothetical protein n=1 Tax=Pseudomonas aeruginosa TaxID=287 RepID=UPI001A7E945A
PSIGHISLVGLETDDLLFGGHAGPHPPAVIPPQEKTSNLLTTCAKNAMFRPRCTRTAQSEQFATARQYNQEIAA